MTKQNGNDLLIPSIEDIDMIVFDVDGTLMDLSLIHISEPTRLH